MNSNNNAVRDDPYFQTSGALLNAAKDWSSIVENFPYGSAAVILYILLYQSELIPRWLSVWGLAGAALMLAMGLLRLFGKPVIYLAIPLILNELVLAVWLIVTGFNSSETALIIVGVLFITALVSSMLSGSGATEDPDYLTALSENENKVLRGVLFQIILTATVVAIPIVLFPILSEQNEILALGYIGARIFEGFFDALIAISILLLLTLSREYVKAGTPTAKTDIAENK
jgi:NADH:ubiquinone oxidoreductase subunit 6 (subunit J)